MVGQAEPWAVGELVQRIRMDLREDPTLRDIAVVGEASGVFEARSGHLYFDLKDKAGLLGCVAFRADAARLAVRPSDGEEVIVIGRVDLYPERGKIQLYVREVRPAQQLGAREAARQALLDDLRAEGALERPRRPMPSIPQHLCIITSPGSAAAADMRAGIEARWPGLRCTFIGVQVQGEGAVGQVVRAIEAAHNLSPQPDVLVCSRGGGSADDLWTFNLEPVVRALLASDIPTVSAIGHESDLLLTDLVADLRAKTPTAAIEQVVPLRTDIEQRLDEAARRMEAGARRNLADARTHLANLTLRLRAAPMAGIHASRHRLAALGSRLRYAATRRIDTERAEIERLSATLSGLDPSRVLARGYAMATDAAGRPLSSITQTPPGAQLHLRMRDGVVLTEVKETHGDEPND